MAGECAGRSAHPAVTQLAEALRLPSDTPGARFTCWQVWYRGITDAVSASSESRLHGILGPLLRALRRPNTDHGLDELLLEPFVNRVLRCSGAPGIAE